MKLSSDIVRHIERQVVLGALAPGDKLPTEQELGEQFGVSRTVVRDATRALTARGLIDVKQGQGTTVANNGDSNLGEALAVRLVRSSVTMGDVIDARAALETQLAPLAARHATDADVKRIADALGGFSEAVRRQAWRVAQDRHLAFHLGLLAAVNLPALQVMLGPLSEIIVISSLPPRSNAPELWDLERHEEIFLAVRARDEAAADSAMRGHFAATEGSEYATLRATLFRDAPAAQDVFKRFVLGRKNL